MFEIVRTSDGWVASKHKTLELAMNRWKKTSKLFACSIREVSESSGEVICE